MDKPWVRRGKLSLAAIIGASAVALLVPFTQEVEGDIPQAYFDMAGVPTICSGITEGLTPDDVLNGLTLSKEECSIALENELTQHAKAVALYTPSLIGHPNQTAAAVAFSYNIGTTGYKNSTAAKEFNKGNWYTACHAFALWNKVDGKVIKGLVNRRNAEMKMCLRDIPEEYNK